MAVTLVPKSGVTLLWGIGYTLTGYILQSADAETTSEVARTTDESGETVAYAFYDQKKTIKVGGVVKSGTVLPEPGDTITINSVLYVVLPPVSERRSAAGFVQFEISAERAEANSIPAA